MKSLKIIFIFSFLLFLTSFNYANQINNNGYWEGKDSGDDHVYDGILSWAMVDFLLNEKAGTVADFGCGMGDYVKDFLSAGMLAKGYDGNPHTSELTGGVGFVQDLSIPFILKEDFDWVISLEVGEHIPGRYETNFIENIVRHAKKGVILSWAVVGQGGYGHVNCRNNPYIKKRLESYGFVSDAQAENYLRKNSFYPWFKNTIMVFRVKKNLNSQIVSGYPN